MKPARRTKKVSVKKTAVRREAVKLAKLEAKISQLNDELERVRYELEAATATADHFANSYFWVIVTKYRQLLNSHLPNGTRRRAVWEWMFRRATKPLRRTHSEYGVTAADHTQTKPPQGVNSPLDNATFRSSEAPLPKITYVMHFPPGSTESGGTGKHCRLLCSFVDDFVKYVIYPQEYPREHSLIVEEYSPFGGKEKEFSYFSGARKTALISNKETEQTIGKILTEHKPDIVHFQHLLGLPLNSIRIAKEHSLKIVITLHDAYLLCPDFTILEMGEKHCDGCTDLHRCDLCLQTRYNLKQGFQQKWREACRAMLELADMIIVPSKYQRDLYARTLNIDANRVTVIEHVIPSHPITLTNKPDDLSTLRVGFVGHIVDKAKGRDVILQLLKENKDDSIEWHFFGEGSDIRGHLRDAKIEPRGKLIFHGYYDEGKLPSTLTNANITVVVIPSIKYESYGYVLTEVWQAGIPVIAANIGAIGERIMENGGGWVYPLGSNAHSVLELIAKNRTDPMEYKSKVTEVRSMKHQTFSEYVSRYKRIYSDLISRPRS